VHLAGEWLGGAMELFRYSRSIYGGSDVMIGASWDLLPWFVGAAMAVIVIHAAVKAFVSRRVGAPRGALAKHQ
jgi:hypothetical protein